MHGEEREGTAWPATWRSPLPTPRNLLLQNILLSADKARAKIGDVGFSHIIGQSPKGAVPPPPPDALYAAPEQLGGGACGTKADIYSLGILLVLLVTGEAPARGAMRSVR